MRKTHLLSLLVTTALCVTAAGAYAKGGGGAGGSSAGHISSQGLTNSNGHDSLDRDKGHARSADRHETHAATHHKHSLKPHAK